MKPNIQKMIQELWLYRRALLFAGGTLLLAGAVIFFALAPTWQQIAALQNQRKQEEARLQEAQARLELVRTAEQQYGAQYILSEQALPAQKEPLEFLSTLEVIANEARLQVVSYDLTPGLISTESAVTTGESVAKAKPSPKGQKAPKGPEVQSSTIEIELSGSFSGLKQFVLAIESALPAMEIDEMSLESAAGAASNNADRQYKALLTIRIYQLAVDVKKLAAGGAQPLTPAQKDVLRTLESMRVRVATQSAQPVSGGTNPEIFLLEDR